MSAGETRAGLRAGPAEAGDDNQHRRRPKNVRMQPAHAPEEE